jgi:hypothetical protein
MQIEFAGTPKTTADDALEVPARVDGCPVVCVVAGEVFSFLSSGDGPRDRARLFRDHEDLFRRVLLDKLGLGATQRPDRVLILAADVSNRRF